MNPSPSVTISAGGYTASVSLRGGQLLSLTVAEPGTGQRQNLVVPAEKGPDAFPGAVLAPWPNRVAQAKYSYGDEEYQLEVSEESTGAALHGLLGSVDFTIDRQRDHEVHLTGRIPATDGYPWALDVVLMYRLGAQLGLTTTLMTRHTADDDAAESSAEQSPTAPYGAGFHPYLTAGDAPLKACRLKLPASRVAVTKPSGTVVRTSTVAGDLDLTSAPLLAGLSIDHAYTGLPEGGWIAELTHGPSGLMVRMISDTPWAQVYTGDRIQRAGVAVEPMTCPPNAFNTGDNLVHLEPGQWHRVGYSIEAIRR